MPEPCRGVGCPGIKDKGWGQREGSGLVAGRRLWWSGIICWSFWTRLRRGSEAAGNPGKLFFEIAAPLLHC